MEIKEKKIESEFYTLQKNENGYFIKTEYVKDYLKQVFGKPLQIGLAQSATEKTVVVSYSDAEDVVQKLFWIAAALKQDCIAYSIQDGANVLGGALVGEYAHEWNYGVFNSTYFIQPMF